MITLSIDGEVDALMVAVIEADTEFAEEALMVFDLFMAEISLKGISCIVLDLKGARWTSLRALKMIMLKAWELRKTGGDLRLTGINPYLRNLLDMFGMTAMFYAYATRAEAVKSFRKEGE